MVNFWVDSTPPTSAGTGVAKTTINGGNDYNVSQKAGALIEMTPEAISTAALTAAETILLRYIVESAAIPSITPKEFVATFANGGLSTFQFALHPLYQARALNTPTPYATTPITFSVQAQIANTAAPETSVTLLFTDGGPLEPEQFYTAPADETNTGTAAGEVAGGAININGGAAINYVYALLTSGVVTASESYEGRGTIASPNFINVPSPQRFSAQSIATGLNTPISVATVADRWWKVWLPIGNTFNATTSLLLDEALTATGNFIVGCGYRK